MYQIKNKLKVPYNFSGIPQLKTCNFPKCNLNLF